MNPSFDPYHRWLGIPPEDQPPTHYRLLGVKPFESDEEVLAAAADRQMTFLRTFQQGQNAALSQKLLNEVAAAQVCLLDPIKRAAYDQQLRQAAQQKKKAKAAPLSGPVPAAADGSAAPPLPLAGDVEDFKGAVTQLGPSRYVLQKRAREARQLKLAVAAVSLGLIALFGWILWGRGEAPTEVQVPSSTSANPSTPPKNNSNGSTSPTPNRVQALTNIQHELITARDLISQRRPSEVADVFAQLSNKHISEGQSAEAARLQTLAGRVDQFWKAAFSAVAALKTPVYLKFDQQEVELVDTEPAGTLTVRQNQKLLRYTVNTLPGPLVYQLVAPYLPSTPNSLATLAAFDLTDPQGDRQRGARSAQFAAQKGEAVEELLAQLNQSWPTNVSFDPGTPVEEPSLGHSPAGETSKRLPVPSSEQYDKALETIKSILGDEYTSAKSPAECQALADRLLDFSEETQDTSERYVVLDQALRLAVEAVNPGSAEVALLAICDDYDVDDNAVRAVLIERFLAKELANYARLELADLSQRLLNLASQAHQFAGIDRLCEASIAAARKAKLTTQAKELTQRKQDLDQLHTTTQRGEEAATTLKAKPDDTDAHLARGEFLCFVQGNWDEGLKHLLQGSDTRLHDLAQRDLTQRDAEQRAQLAADWRDQAKDYRGTLRQEIWRHCIDLYQETIPQLTGLIQSNARKQMQDLEDRAAKEVVGGGGFTPLEGAPTSDRARSTGSQLIFLTGKKSGSKEFFEQTVLELRLDRTMWEEDRKSSVGIWERSGNELVLKFSDSVRGKLSLRASGGSSSIYTGIQPGTLPRVMWRAERVALLATWNCSRGGQSSDYQFFSNLKFFAPGRGLHTYSRRMNRIDLNWGNNQIDQLILSIDGKTFTGTDSSGQPISGTRLN